jgi:O-acetyl-ADP-ribose deacetylase (regulator of RNase III)
MNSVLAETQLSSGKALQLVHGDLAAETADAIVNAANEFLQHGGGVAGVISRRGGPAIQRESDAWVREHGPVSHAEPAYTSGGELLCRYVIHAVGPVWGEGGEDAKLADAVGGSLRLADRLGLSSLSLPAISTGIFGFPRERAAGVFFRAIPDYFSQNPSSGLHQVRLVLFDQASVDVFLQTWPK